jgi:hypothetical protein
MEMVDKLRERTGVSYEEAREALDLSRDDMLDALIWLEKNGKVVPPRVGRYSTDNWARDADDGYDDISGENNAKYYNSRKAQPAGGARGGDVKNAKGDKKARQAHKKSQTGPYGRYHRNSGAYYYDERDSRGKASAYVKSAAGYFGKALHIGNTTMFEISRYGKEVIKLPLTILIVACFLFFRILIIMLPVGLFFGFRYRLSGEYINDKPFNSAMDSASKTVDVIKDAFTKTDSDK